MMLRGTGMRGLLIIVLLVAASVSQAAIYGEYRGELKFRGSDLDQSINYLGLGYKFENNVYIDLGHCTDGTSIELGYKYKFGDSWVVKGKWEGNEVDDLIHKLQIEIRYSGPGLNGGYFEYKNELKLENSDFDESINHLRIGYRFENDVYFEIGPRTDGVSGEVGYKYNFSDAWSFKGKWEGNETINFKHKIEAEIRYNF